MCAPYLHERGIHAFSIRAGYKDVSADSFRNSTIRQLRNVYCEATVAFSIRVVRVPFLHIPQQASAVSAAADREWWRTVLQGSVQVRKNRNSAKKDDMLHLQMPQEYQDAFSRLESVQVHLTRRFTID